MRELFGRQLFRRKLLSLGLLSLLLVMLWAVIQPQRDQLATATSSSQPDSSQQMIHSHLGDRPIASGAIALAPAVPVTAEPVTYATVDGKPITGYLARPANSTAPLPGIIVIHEWWGLNENIQQMTERLAGEGYTALAVDLYAGSVAQTPEQARALTQAAAQTPQLLEDNLKQAYQYLETEQNSPKIASLGWCFGGSWSLNTALLFPTELDAAVIYYGSQLVTERDRLTPLQMPILGIFGALDQNPSVETVRSFEAALNELGKSAEIYVYDGANHAFANPSGTRYNAQAAEDAWGKTTAFLSQHLND